METTKVYYYSDGMYSREIERKSVKCPFCGVINIPEYLFLKNVERSDFFNVCIYNHRTTKTNQKYPSVNL